MCAYLIAPGATKPKILACGSDSSCLATAMESLLWSLGERMEDLVEDFEDCKDEH